MKILVADNVTAIAEILRKYCEKKNHHVDVAFDGEKGLELIKKGDYDIAFLDEDMPELTGLEIAKYVKQNNINTKTVILSGYVEIDEELCKRVGADEYLRKPVDFDEIEDIIEKYQMKDG